MTDRINALTVVLEKDTRTDDVEALVNAIKCLRNVLKVDLHVAEALGDHVSYSRARQELGEKMWEVLYPRTINT
jgi:hypothetical protein